MIQDAPESGETGHAKDFSMKTIIHDGYDGKCSEDCYDICFFDNLSDPGVAAMAAREAAPRSAIAAE